MPTLTPSGEQIITKGWEKKKSTYTGPFSRHLQQVKGITMTTSVSKPNVYSDFLKPGKTVSAVASVQSIFLSQTLVQALHKDGLLIIIKT